MDHSIFYYPYGNFQDTQALLLKVAALYFDKLNILDPLKASGGRVGSGVVEKDVELLENANILERIEPEEVLQEYEDAITEAIRADLRDPEFVELCESSNRQMWTVALAKVPRDLRDDPKFQPMDQAMQRLMGRWREEVPSDYERHAAVHEKGYAEVGISTPTYDEYREIRGKDVEYRYADYALPLGEAIMVNHALFAGLLHTEATPLTDDPFHNRVLDLKIKRAREIPEVREVLEDRIRQRRLRANAVAWTALRDTDLQLPAMSPELPLEVILEHRGEHSSELERTREALAKLARRIREDPWSEEFAEDLEYQTIPDIEKQLEEARRARDAWIKSKRGRLALKGTGIGLGAAAATVSLLLSPTPLLPIPIIIGLLGLTGSAMIPGLELMQDWREGQGAVTENGLHYLISW
jgi:hypothetical protein